MHLYLSAIDLANMISLLASKTRNLNTMNKYLYYIQILYFETKSDLYQQKKIKVEVTIVWH